MLKLFLILFLSMSSLSFANKVCSKAHSFGSSTEAIDQIFQLGSRKLFIDSFEYQHLTMPNPSFIGICSTTSIVNAMQILRVMIGDKKLPTPHADMIEIYNTFPEFRWGKLTDPQLFQLHEWVQSKFKQQSLKVSLDEVPFADQSLSRKSKNWSPTDLNPLKLKRNQIKILLFRVIDPEGKQIGRHHVIIRDFDGEVLNVINPDNPWLNTVTTADLDNKAVSVDQTPLGRSRFLVQPASESIHGYGKVINLLPLDRALPNGWQFLITQVYTIQIEP
jgi:hypothetical protein